MKHLAPLVLAALLITGCEAPRPALTPAPVASVTPTAAATAIPVASPTAGASSTPTPMQTSRPAPTPTLAWDVPPKTGIAHIDAIVAAVIAGDAARLQPYVTGVMVDQCSDGSYQCRRDVPTATSLRAFGHGYCPGDGNFVLLVPPPQGLQNARVESAADVASSLASSGMRYLIGVYENGNLRLDSSYRYRVAFQRDLQDARGGLYLRVTDVGIAESVEANADPAHGCLLPHGGEQALIAPPP